MKTRMSSFGYILPDAGVDRDTQEQLEQHQVDLEQVYHSALARAKRIDESEELTSTGKLRQKKELTEDIREELEKFEKIATHPMMFQNGPSIQMEIDQLKTKLKPRDSGQDPVLDFLQQQEIRNYLRSQEPTQTEALVQQAAARGDFTFLDAVTAAPEGPHKFILSKTQQVLTQKKLAAQNPVAAARIEMLETAQSRLRGMISSMKGTLKKQGLFQEPDQDIEFLNQAG